MTRLSRTSLFWAPRVLSIAFIAFLSLFSLDVFGEGLGFWATVMALIIHLLPSIALLVALILAWRWEWIGAVVYAAAGVLYIGTVRVSHVAPALKLTWILAIAAPALIVAALFLANWRRHSELHMRHS